MNYFPWLRGDFVPIGHDMRQLGIQGLCYCILEYEVVFIVTFNYVRQADLASMVTTGGMVLKWETAASLKVG